jgi:hypothetical protein
MSEREVFELQGVEPRSEVRRRCDVECQGLSLAPANLGAGSLYLDESVPRYCTTCPSEQWSQNTSGIIEQVESYISQNMRAPRPQLVVRSTSTSFRPPSLRSRLQHVVLV